MSRVTPLQENFNGGELSPHMHGRVNHEVYDVAVKEMVGFTPRPQGPLEASPGFEYIATARGPCRLIPFEPYVTQGYMLEFSDQAVRFYTNDVQLESAPGVPLELVTPWAYEQLAELNYFRSNDVIYLVHGDVEPQLLVRDGAESFALETLELENGPFDDRNDDESLTLSFNGVVGNVTMTASAALFEPGDVGGLLEVEAGDLGTIPSWEPGLTVTIGALRQWAGRVYQAVGGGTAMRTGSVQPLHTNGIEWDGAGQGQDLNEQDAGGIQWLYMHDMFGRVKMTSYISPTQMGCKVLRRLPLTISTSYTYNDYRVDYFDPGGGYDFGGSYTPPGTGNYTESAWRWRFGAFSDRRGWPEVAAIWEQRLILSRGDRIYGSVVGSLTNFDRLNENGDISADQAFSGTIDNPNPVRWMVPGDELFIGTAVSEHVLRAQTVAKALGPGNIKLATQTSEGSATQRAIEINGKPIFLQRNSRKLMMMYNIAVDRYDSEDLTRYADHIGNSPLSEFCWQKQPMQILWAVREDGSLVNAALMPKEEVLGFAQRPMAEGLAARSIASITDPDGKSDQLWTAVEVDDGRWFVMLMGAWRNAGQSDPNGLMADAALKFEGPATDILSVPHLSGRTVVIVGDGKLMGSQLVPANGEIVLDIPVTEAMVGLDFPAHVELLPLEAGGDNGSAQMKMKRVGRIGFRLLNALGLKVTVGAASKIIENLFTDTPLDESIPFFTGDILFDMIGTWDRQNILKIERVSPKQSTILALMQTVEVAQR